jgi:hypothetical protein
MKRMLTRIWMMVAVPAGWQYELERDTDNRIIGIVAPRAAQ